MLPFPFSFWGSEQGIPPENRFFVEEGGTFLDRVVLEPISRVINKFVRDTIAGSEDILNRRLFDIIEQGILVDSVTLATIDRIVNKEFHDSFTGDESVFRRLRIALEEQGIFTDRASIDEISRAVAKIIHDSFAGDEFVDFALRLSLAEQGIFTDRATVDAFVRAISNKTVNDSFTGDESISLFRWLKPAITESGTFIDRVSKDEVPRAFVDQIVHDQIIGAETVSFTASEPLPEILSCNATFPNVTIEWTAGQRTESVFIELHDATTAAVVDTAVADATPGLGGSVTFNQFSGSYFGVVTPYSGDNLTGTVGFSCVTNIHNV